MLALIGLAGAYLAQSQAAPTSPAPIVVEGRDTREAATDYVDKLLPTRMGDEIGRFEDPICPKVIGLAEPYNKQVIDRIREVAKATNIDVASGDCEPNLVVVTAPDKRVMIDVLRKSRPGYFEGVATDQLKRLANSARPFASWQVTDLVAADGMPIGKGSSFPGGGNGARETGPAARNHDSFIEGDFARLRTTQSPSRVLSTTKPRVLSSVVVIETGALRGATIDQLADFALVKAMLPTELREGEAPATSILGLFNPGVSAERGPQSVTQWDFAFLKSLTNTRSNTSVDVQKAEIRDQMVREVKKTQSGQP